MAKDNLTKVENIDAIAREIDFVTRFGDNWDSLQEILGIMRPIRKAPGSQLISYIASVDLEDGEVGEGEEIPYSLTTVEPVRYDDVELLKYAKAVSIEAVNKWGASIAVEKTDEAFLNELQGNVLDSFYTFLQTGTLTDNANNFQMGVALAVGKVKDKFKKMRKTATEIVVFVNTLDAYKYLGVAELTIQTSFGIDYVENFMGARLIMTSEIPEGKIIATPVENIDLYYVDPADGDFQQLGLNYTVQGETNLIGFHVNGNYNTAVGEVFALMGMKLWAEYLDGIAVVTIGDSPSPIITPSVTLDKATATIANIGDTLDLTATTVPDGETVTWDSNDKTVATVSDGTVTAVKAGEATITASITVDGIDYTDTCTVTVSGA